MTITYSNPHSNPFRTLPKDAPARGNKDGPSNRGAAGGWSDRGNQNGGTFRGRTPGYNSNRGAMNNGNMNGNTYNNNRNFSGPPMGNMGGFNPPMGGFPNNPMGGQFSGGFNRGGMMGGGMRGNMRGGRGGMINGGMPMGGMPMGGMPMGGMPGAMGGMPMNMGQMGGMQGMINSNLVLVYSKSRGWQVDSRHPASQHPSGLTPPMVRHSYIPAEGVSRAPDIQEAPGTTDYGALGSSVAAQGAPRTCVPGAHGNHQTYTLPLRPPSPHHITQAEKQLTLSGGGFQNLQPHFNPAFFQPNPAAGGDWQNPHGAKRPRPE